tara:strand:+ start:2750 stop:3058 length:309 start_codon:yes stop_codon:yes gene_type:complete
MRKDTVKVSFSLHPEDVRKISANAITYILERFKNRYLQNIDNIAAGVTFENGTDILEAIEKLFDDIDKTSHEFEEITSLLMQIKGTLDRPVPATASLPPASA